MRALCYIFLLLLVASCAIRSANFVLREPGDSSELSALFERHRLYINQDRMLIYNGEEQLYVPEGNRVIVRVVDGEETTFTLEEDE